MKMIKENLKLLASQWQERNSDAISNTSLFTDIARSMA